MRKKIILFIAFFACTLLGYAQSNSSNRTVIEGPDPFPPLGPGDPGIPLDPLDPFAPDQGNNGGGSGGAINPSNRNYIITKIYKKPTTSVLGSPSLDQVQTNITYFDGLGRPIQQIANGQSASSKDIITHIAYDGFGRQIKEYMPYEGSSSYIAFEPNAETGTLNFYNTAKYDNTANPFSEKQIEASPLNRTLKQAAPGNAWALTSGHEIKVDYQTNNSNEVRLFQTNTVWDAGLGLYDISISDQGFYLQNQLYKTVTYDENTTPGTNKGTEEFKNKEGQIVLKRTYDSGTKHDTYYVYDIYGNLTYVLPPKADGIITAAILDGLCYQYKYDNKNRLAEKKLPGKQWEFIVYDKLDRPVVTGPVNSPFNNDASIGWLITKYDVFGRIVYTGWMNQSANSQTRNSLQTAQNSAAVLYETKQTSGTIDGIQAYYSNSIAPTNFKLLTVNYYDNYTFPNAQSQPSSIEGQTVLANIKGIASGNWTRALTTPSSTAGETNTIFYDEKARPIKIYLQNYLGGYTSSVSSIDFAGKTLYTITKHKRTSSSAETTIREEFTYSDQDRLLTHTHQINGGTIELLADNKYDALGQLESKNVGNTKASPLQKIDYKYNIRGWLTAINDVNNLQQNSDPLDLFAFKINYNKQPLNTQVQALFNGNIAETFWKTASDNSLRTYGYVYDDLNRLKSALYGKPNDAIPFSGAYNESLSYDKNGNIKFLHRYGDSDASSIVFKIDDLTYDYLNDNSNQLAKVTENPSGNDNSGFIDGNKTGDDYSYDDNGNMTVDKNKNITLIAYNHLNLPKKITFGTGNTIEYIYNAAGLKLEKIVTQNGNATTTNYLGGFQYKNNTLEFFPTAEGYFDAVNQKYVYQYKDHLGNIRVIYAKNAGNVLEIIDENNYYPFGLKHNGYNGGVASTNSGQKYKYNGKELQDELSLNLYDFGTRNYDPALGRWMNIDPLAEQMRRFSPYNYAFNNPMRFIDPDGMAPYDVTINGDKAQEALAELQKAVGDGITLSLKDGKVGYERNGQGALTKNASDLVNAIDDHSVTASINASGKDYASNGDPLVGNQMGATLNDNGTATGNQEINPSALSEMDAINGKPGQTTLHETMEAFTVGKTALSSGQNIAPATWADGLNPNSPYRLAHDNVTPQSGEIRIFDQKGNETFNPSDKNNWSKVKSNVNELNYGTRKEGSTTPFRLFHTIKR
ncbi:DUF6443 domain-containing protein [Flavobacterium panacagri]|uniref:DUF6443 domain-containing protein n=1 Tax=Flavobacterium panacagri TaxID=3034146 RepID=UPI0025A4F22C|nr:DUF6443 domain-containing protein [Flavobacterium panacagri]